MSPGQWEAVKEAFEQIADLDDLNRVKALQQIPDATVSAEVARLVELHHRGSPLLDQLSPKIDLLRVPTNLRALVPGQLAAGRFRVLRFIAEGGMGEVYEALDERLNENVALKVVRQDTALREATLAQSRFSCCACRGRRL